jgi:hypothetical protein
VVQQPGGGCPLVASDLQHADGTVSAGAAPRGHTVSATPPERKGFGGTLTNRPPCTARDQRDQRSTAGWFCSDSTAVTPSYTCELKAVGCSTHAQKGSATALGVGQPAPFPRGACRCSAPRTALVWSLSPEVHQGLVPRRQVAREPVDGEGILLPALHLRLHPSHPSVPRHVSSRAWECLECTVAQRDLSFPVLRGCGGPQLKSIRAVRSAAGAGVLVTLHEIFRLQRTP